MQPQLSVAELTALRNSPGSDPIPAVEGLPVTNASEELRLLFIDGVSVAWAAPGARDVIRGVPRGRYVTQWRTFLGDGFDAPVTQSVPSVLPDAGAPK